MYTFKIPLNLKQSLNGIDAASFYVNIVSCIYLTPTKYLKSDVDLTFVTVFLSMTK